MTDAYHGFIHPRAGPDRVLTGHTAQAGLATLAGRATPAAPWPYPPAQGTPHGRQKGTMTQNAVSTRTGDSVHNQHPQQK